MAKGLTATVIFEAKNLNYGEGFGAGSELKKICRGNGDIVSYLARQATRFDITRLGEMLFGWNLHTVDKSKDVIQFKDEFTIKDSTEMDLFGYMKTNKKDKESSGGANTRKAAVRLTHAISLEPFKGDMDFLTNKGLADRIGEHPNIANVEQHFSFYSYTFTIDLDRIGIDKDKVNGKEVDIEIDNNEKAKRVCEFLDIIKVLHREIRGSGENLSPVFIIGGVYNIPNPFFLSRTELECSQKGYELNAKALDSALELTLLDECVRDNTSIGIVNGKFNNEEELNNLTKDGLMSIQNFFEKLKSEVNDYYGVK